MADNAWWNKPGGRRVLLLFLVAFSVLVVLKDLINEFTRRLMRPAQTRAILENMHKIYSTLSIWWILILQIKAAEMAALFDLIRERT